VSAYKLVSASIFCCLVATVGVRAQSTASRSRVESLLDSWQNRTSAREGLLKLGEEPDIIKTLGAIAGSAEEPAGRRYHAIGLLATFKGKPSVTVLGRLSETGEPVYRCAAIQALTEIASRAVLPILVSKLDDHCICMQIQSTDPDRTSDVYVSDEAVRALEHITGRTFAQQVGAAHRAVQPWKEWWAKQ